MRQPPLSGTSLPCPTMALGALAQFSRTLVRVRLGDGGPVGSFSACHPASAYSAASRGGRDVQPQPRLPPPNPPEPRFPLRRGTACTRRRLSGSGTGPHLHPQGTFLVQSGRIVRLPTQVWSPRPSSWPLRPPPANSGVASPAAFQAVCRSPSG